MKPTLVLRSSALPEIELETIGPQHLEFLRRLKNAHRQRFFHRDEISPAQQQQWYEGYLQRDHDWMFVMRRAGVERACMGYRIVDGEIDIYNIIREDSGDGRTFGFSQGFELLCAYLDARFDLPISGRVLADNPVVHWARRRGFVPTETGERAGLGYVYLVRKPALRKRHPVSVETRIPDEARPTC